MKLCANCHKELTWHGYVAEDRNFCARSCQIQFHKLSAEEQRAAHYEWVREEALANAQIDAFS